jgi:hypothetical protein
LEATSSICQFIAKRARVQFAKTALRKADEIAPQQREAGFANGVDSRWIADVPQRDLDFSSDPERTY